MQKRQVIFSILAMLLLTICSNVFAQNRRTEAERHPRMEAAVRSLQSAVAELKSAPHDFGGHKREAIEATENAIKQIKLALSFRAREDREHRSMTESDGSAYLQNVSYQNRRVEREEHPRIAAAIAALRDAKVELNEAPHDFGGHKAEAISAIDNAITQLQFALDFRVGNDRGRR